MAGDAIYTELILLKLRDETAAALDAAVARFAAAAAQMQASMNSVSAGMTAAATAGAAKFTADWSAAFASWQQGMASVVAAQKAATVAMAATQAAAATATASAAAGAQAGGGGGGGFGLLKGLSALGGLAAAKDAYEGARDFDKALHDMGTLLADAQMPVAQFNELLKETGHMATQVSERFNLDVLGVIKGYKEALSSGWNADELKDMGEAAGTMARAIHSSFDDAASILSTYRFSQHLTAQETEKEAGDMVFNLINIAKKLDVPEFQRSLGGLLIVAHAAGQNFKDVGAGLTVLTNQGMTTAQSATSLTNVFARLSTMSGKVKEEFLGMSRAVGLGDDVWDTHKHHLTDIMATVEKVTGGNVELIKKLFPDQRMLRGAEAMTQNINQLGKAYQDMGEKATVATAAQRSMDNAFDRVEAGWKRITNATKEALVVAADYWIKGKQLDPADRKPGQDKAEDNYARYGNLYASDQEMDEHRKALAGGRDNSDNLNRDFAQKIREVEGFAARVRAVGDYQSKLEFAAKQAADEHERSARALEKSKEDAELQAKAAAAEYETRKATEALTKQMSKPGKNDALHVGMGWLEKAAEGILGASGLPDIQQLKDTANKAMEIGKEYNARQASLGKELGQEMLEIYKADALAKEHFETEKLNAAKAVNAEMKRDLEALAGLQTSLNERMFQHNMAHAGQGGKDPARAARFAQNQLEEQEGKVNAAIKGGALSEKDFARMIEEFRRTGDARGTALTSNKDGDRADREARERDGIEQGMIAAFRKMDTDRAAGSVDAINKKVFKGKSKEEVAKEALQKTEAKHVDQNVNMNVALNLQGITTSQIQGMVKDMLTGALKDIAARGTGITGRPTTSRGAPVGRTDSSDDDGDTE